MKHFARGVFVAIAGTVSLPADTDMSGKWLVKQDRDFRGNPAVAVECTFRQKGTLLSVRCGPNAMKGSNEMKGEVHGRKITWGLEKTGIPPMLEDRLVLRYAAESNKSANALKGTWTLKSSVLDERGTFEATRKP
jgi:hypothetical protein